MHLRQIFSSHGVVTNIRLGIDILTTNVASSSRSTKESWRARQNPQIFSIIRRRYSQNSPSISRRCRRDFSTCGRFWKELEKVSSKWLTFFDNSSKNQDFQSSSRARNRDYTLFSFTTFTKVDNNLSCSPSASHSYVMWLAEGKNSIFRYKTHHSVKNCPKNTYYPL